MPIVSIVVPIYNSSKTIGDCLRSLFNQTLDDIEIICVDDHSTDDSVDIVRTLMEKDERLRLVLHENNYGTLKTRFDGVMASSSHYIMFLDSDDQFVPDACRVASSAMERTGADMLQFGTAIEQGNVSEVCLQGYEHFLRPLNKPLYNENILKMQFKGICWHVWNRIYDSGLCKKAYQSAGEDYLIYSDDLYISFFLSYYAKHFESISEKLYIYKLDTGMSNSLNHYDKMKIICDNSSYIYRCIDFLKANDKKELIDEICYGTDLLQLKQSFIEWSMISDDEEKIKGAKILKETWDNDYFRCLYFENCVRYHNIYDGDVARVEPCISKLIRENDSLRERDSELQNSTVKAVKNVFSSLKRKIG